MQGQCRAECESIDSCEAGEVCAAWRFDDGSEGTFCSAFDGRFTACDDDEACDSDAGFRCVEGTCTVPCRAHRDCASVGRCASLGDGTYCVADTPARSGRYFGPCPRGNADCDQDAGFLCVGAGEGDLDSYCTTDCTSDDECPEGYRCGAMRVPPCGRACGVSGTGGNTNCAPTNEIGEGRRYQCGVLTAIRHVCVRRTFCAPCETDEDCLAVPGQICARDASGERICTVPCDPSADSCPWGNAAECGLFDAERGIPTCSHRFGSCRGSGKGCEPCLEDADCGSSGICASFSFSRERFCIDLTTSCDCGDDADENGTCLGHGCPDSPGGLPMTCLDERGASDPLNERCFGASDVDALAATRRAGCWPRK